MNDDRGGGSLGRRLAMALGLFVLLCGVLLLAVGGGRNGNEGGEVTTGQRAWSALQSTNEAERALNSSDYGTAQRHMQNARDELTKVVQDLDAD